MDDRNTNKINENYNLKKNSSSTFISLLIFLCLLAFIGTLFMGFIELQYGIKIQYILTVNVKLIIQGFCTIFGGELKITSSSVSINGSTEPFDSSYLLDDMGNVEPYGSGIIIYALIGFTAFLFFLALIFRRLRRGFSFFSLVSGGLYILFVFYGSIENWKYNLRGASYIDVSPGIGLIVGICLSSVLILLSFINFFVPSVKKIKDSDDEYDDEIEEDKKDLVQPNNLVFANYGLPSLVINKDELKLLKIISFKNGMLQTFICQDKYSCKYLFNTETFDNNNIKWSYFKITMDDFIKINHNDNLANTLLLINSQENNLEKLTYNYITETFYS